MTQGKGLVPPSRSLPRSSDRSFRADIQGLRAVAIVLVIADHVGLAPFTGGYVGVDVFFVISGTLITGHLLGQWERTGRIDLGDFYARRMRRLLPASLLVAAVTLVAALALMPPLAAPDLVDMAIATAAYVPNLLLASTGTSYLAEEAPSPFQHFWSLGVEEQFYLLWPVVILLALVLARRSPRAVPVLLCGVVATSLLVCLLVTARSQPWAFFSLPSRAWELAIGGGVAVALRSGQLDQGLLNRSAVRALLGWLGLAAIVVAAVLYSERTLYPGHAALLPVLGAALVVLTGAGTARGGPSLLLGTRQMQYVGRISYSLYLWHWPLLVIPQAAVGLATPLPLWSRLMLMAVAAVLAELTVRFVEEPGRRMRVLTSRRPRSSILAGLAASAAVVALAAAGLPVVMAQPLATPATAPAASADGQPVFTPFVPANLAPGLGEADDTIALVNRLGCHRGDAATTTVSDCVLGDASAPRSVALFGDSHAAHWSDGLEVWARSAGWAVRPHTKAGCPSVPVLVVENGNPFGECTQWRDAVLTELRADPPTVVLVLNTDQLPFVSTDRPRVEQWSRAVSDLADLLPRSSSVLMLANTPELPEDAPRCLSHRLTHTAACGLDRDAAVDSGWIAAERAAAESAGFTYADLTDRFCSATRCDPVVGDVLLYRDTSHLTPQWSRLMAGPLGAAITAAAAAESSGVAS